MPLRRLPALLAAVLIAALVAPSVAPATTIAYQASGSVRKVGQHGPTLIYRGSVTSPGFGRAQVTQRLRITGLSASGTFRVRYRGGTLRGRVTAHASARGGDLAFAGSLRITGGTGRFAGARGSGRYSGTTSLDLSRATFEQRGTVRY